MIETYSVSSVKQNSCKTFADCSNVGELLSSRNRNSQLFHDLLQFARDPLGIAAWRELDRGSDLYLHLAWPGEFLSSLLYFEQSVDAVRYGDVSAVAASDRLLAEMEGFAPVSHSWRTIDSVVGMCPNVPQYLSGNPYSMRLKRRFATATAPVSVFVELVASAGINAETCLTYEAALARIEVIMRQEDAAKDAAASASDLN